MFDGILWIILLTLSQIRGLFRPEYMGVCGPDSGFVRYLKVSAFDCLLYPTTFDAGTISNLLHDIPECPGSLAVYAVCGIYCSARNAHYLCHAFALVTMGARYLLRDIMFAHRTNFFPDSLTLTTLVIICRHNVTPLKVFSAPNFHSCR